MNNRFSNFVRQPTSPIPNSWFNPFQFTVSTQNLFYNPIWSLSPKEFCKMSNFWSRIWIPKLRTLKFENMKSDWKVLNWSFILKRNDLRNMLNQLEMELTQDLITYFEKWISTFFSSNWKWWSCFSDVFRLQRCFKHDQLTYLIPTEA